MLSDLDKLKKQNFILYNKLKEKINCDIYFAESQKPSPIVILLHGFKGFKDWGFLPCLAEKLALAGNIVINFDFSRNGIIDREKLIYNPEIFASNLISIEIDDTLTIINAINQNQIPELDLGNIWNREIYLAGFSRGGGIAILISNLTKIDKLALLAPISTFNRYTTRQIENWEKSGKLIFKNSLTNQKLHINYSYIEEILENEGKYDLIHSISQLKMPILIVHGTADLTVNVKESKMLFEAINSEPKKLILIENAGHTFNAKHPYNQEVNEVNEIIQHLIKFFANK